MKREFSTIFDKFSLKNSNFLNKPGRGLLMYEIQNAYDLRNFKYMRILYFMLCFKNYTKYNL